MVATKVNLSSTNELRNVVDDRLPEVMGHIGYEQDFSIVDRKLAVGYVTGIMAAAVFLLDKKLGFKASYNYVVLLLALYSVGMAYFYYFTSTVEKSIKYVGYDKKEAKDKVTISTEVKDKYEPVLTIEVNLNDKSVKQDVHFNKFFNETGYLEVVPVIDYFKLQLSTLDSKAD
ncbi:hypothetical protein BABINDRAFT_169249 [Babjeviella inositovora NRRL Y-12698]|uniref:Signal peptidase complex subunit 2 n=1 Tax=Babjeviella inositovora NRRL Y-12698 TaxID=984486 RepID=A0A1E3QI58_9ASCO|nr:uncharacterized protein BABINDRAFT_169249 [Babjeviella inositovora NRRL Y-12698]ODQ77381.1 hypothetical protein BABINDRAFT_169249 [Babjeviella inositovora NRRL Y-12698]